MDTARLKLTPWRPQHIELLARLSALPDVVRHVGDGQVWDAERVARSAGRAEAHWRDHGFGWRVATTQDTGTEIGFIALNFASEGTRGVAPTEYEIGWWIDPAHAGRGYAKEGARAVRDEAFGRLEAPSVIARIQPGNAASIAVAEAIGMRYELETVAEGGVRCEIYRAAANSPDTVLTAPSTSSSAG
jgi:RimJ/RimL family protein N-acetyltransferase